MSEKAKARARKIINGFQIRNYKSRFHKWRRLIQEKHILEKFETRGELKNTKIKLMKYYENIVEENLHLAQSLKYNKERIKQKYMQIIWNTAVRQKRLDRQNAFENWRYFLFIKQKKENKVKKITKHLVLNNQRQAFNQWLKFIKEKKVEQSNSILVQEKNKRKIEKKKWKFELSQCIVKKDELKKLFEHFRNLTRNSHNLMTRIMSHLANKKILNVYLPLQQVVIRKWKSISNTEKYLCKKLPSLFLVHIYKHIYINLKKKYIQKNKDEKYRRAVRKMVFLTKKSFYREAVDKWKGYSYFSRNENYKKNRLNIQEKIMGIQQNISDLNNKLYFKGNLIIMRRKRENLFHILKKEVAQARLLKDTTEISVRNRKCNCMKLAIKKWLSRAIATEKAKLRVKKSESLFNRKILHKCFVAYHQYVFSQRALPKILIRISHSLIFTHKLRGVKILQNYSESHKAFFKNKQAIGAIQFKEIAGRIFRSRYIIYLGFMARNSRWVPDRSDKLTRLVTSLYLSRTRDSLRHLKNQITKLQLIHLVEHKGKRAQTLYLIHHNIEKMQDILLQEGYQEREFLSEINNIQKQKESLIRKAISRWIAYQRGKEDVILALDSWQKQIIIQNKLKNSLRNLCNYYENCSLKKGFQRLLYKKNKKFIQRYT